jgi:transposase-like protein
VSKEAENPTNLLEAIRYFSDQDVATEFVAKLRWPQGPVCPRCGSMGFSYLSTRRLWKCKDCKRQYSVKLGTIFEDSPLGLDKWLPAVWLTANSKNGISSHELARSLGVTQKSAWFMLHRIRLAMQTGSFTKFATVDGKLGGEVEIDETFIGGKAANMHMHKRVQNIKGSGPVGKTAIVGLRQRNGDIRAQVVEQDTAPGRFKGSPRESDLLPVIYRNVKPGTKLYTDSAPYYRKLREDFEHEVVNHAERYVDGRIHTNGLENFWALLKRGLHGTYVSVEASHLFRYLDERVFTYNLRELSDLGRFSALLSDCAGRRLTWDKLTGKA